MASEETLIITTDLPAGQDWAWYADLNVVGLSSRLDEAGREAALSDLQAQWRRRFIRVVPDRIADDPVAGVRSVS